MRVYDLHMDLERLNHTPRNRESKTFKNKSATYISITQILADKVKYISRKNTLVFYTNDLLQLLSEKNWIQVIHNSMERQ